MGRWRPRPPLVEPFTQSSVALLLALKVEDEQTVLVAPLDARSLDWAWEAYGLLEAAVGDFELMIGDGLAERLVAPAARHAQRVARDAHLQLVGHDSGQLDLDDPAVARSVHVRRRIPELLRAAHAPRLRHHPQVTLD